MRVGIGEVEWWSRLLAGWAMAIDGVRFTRRAQYKSESRFPRPPLKRNTRNETNTLKPWRGAWFEVPSAPQKASSPASKLTHSSIRFEYSPSRWVEAVWLASGGQSDSEVFQARSAFCRASTTARAVLRDTGKTPGFRHSLPQLGS